MPSIKAIILIGGPNKGQRFRPLSFDSPKYMFPVGGQTILGHLIDSCLNLVVSDSNLDLLEVLILGFYQQGGVDYLSQNNLQKLVQDKLKNIKMQTDRNDLKIQVRYLQEFTRMGTAGGLYHFRDQIRRGNPDAFLLINGDVCGDFDFNLMFKQHQEITAIIDREGESSFAKKPMITVMTTEASRPESQSYGCIVENPKNHHVIEHYVEKPSTFVSNLINCGAYVCSLGLLNLIESEMLSKNPDASEGLSQAVIPTSDPNNLTSSMGTSDYLSLELDILQQRKFQPYCYSYRTGGSWWCQVKTAASAIYANRQYLASKSTKVNGDITCDDRVQNCTIIGNVYIHPSAIVDSSSVIGPNVSIMENCVIGPGVRVKESIILQSAVIDAHSLIMCSIVGWNCVIGSWARVEGTPSEPDPNQKFAKVQNPPLFNPNGKLNPSITVLGSNVKIPRGNVILNTIVLPHKELGRSYKNEIVL